MSRAPIDSGTTLRRQELLIDVFLAAEISFLANRFSDDSARESKSLIIPCRITHVFFFPFFSFFLFFLLLSSLYVSYNYNRYKLPSTHLVSVICLTWQHLLTSGGHLQASSIKYIKGISYSSVVLT